MSKLASEDPFVCAVGVSDLPISFLFRVGLRCTAGKCARLVFTMTVTTRRVPNENRSVQNQDQQ